MRVHYDEGVANHIGPKPYVGTREGVGEASGGVRIGQPLSRETFGSRVPTSLRRRKSTRAGALLRAAASTRRGLRPWHVRMLFVREPGELRPGREPLLRTVRGGKAGRRGAVAADEWV